jgi:hypothetical protein
LAESDELVKSLLEVGTVYHSLLFSYQRGLKKYMGSNADFYLHPAIEHLLQMDEQGGIKLAESNSFEEAVAVFSEFLTRSKVVKSCVLDKIKDDKYVFKWTVAFGQAKSIIDKLA